MTPHVATRDDSQAVGTFLRGWGGFIAVVVGVAVAFALSPVMDAFVVILHDGLVALGMTSYAATQTLYWLGMISAGVGFIIAIGGSDTRMDRLRGGVGDWSTLLLEVLIVTGTVLLWVFTGSTWTNYVDDFNTYPNSVELPALGLLFLLVVVAVVIRVVRGRRSA